MASGGTVTIETLLETDGVSRGVRDVENRLNGIGKSSSGVGQLTKAFVAAQAAVGLVSKALGGLGSAIDDAVSRYDTLNNFPRVMENLGISADEAKAATERLSDRLQGLPTTLDSATSGVSRFVAKNKDIEKSTDYFLALNDAIIAGAAPAANQEAALEQMTQAYSRGKFEMEEWKSAMVAMPAQMDMVAQSFGMTTDELYNALQSGGVSMDEFMDRIVQLDQEGSNGMASFADQAATACGGIQTNVTNLKNAFVRGFADMLGAVDNLLTSAGLPTIGETIGNIKNVVNDSFGAINGYISTIDLSWFISAFQFASDKVTEFKDALVYWGGQLGISGELFTAFGELVQPLLSALGTAFSAIMDLLTFLAPLFILAANAIGVIFYGALTFVTEAITFLANVLSAIVGFITNFQTHASNAANAVVTAWQAFTSFIGGIPSAFAGWMASMIASVAGFASNLASKASQAGRDFFSNLKSGISNAISSAYQWGADIVGNIARGIRNAIGQVVSAASEVASSIRSFLHFSEPDVGPLSDFHTYMPDMMKLMAEGIYEGTPLVTKAAYKAAGALQGSLIPDGFAAFSAGVPAVAGVTAGAYSTQTASQSMTAEAVGRAVASALDGMGVYLDKRELVGRLADGMDSALGTIRKGHER